MRWFELTFLKDIRWFVLTFLVSISSCAHIVYQSIVNPSASGTWPAHLPVTCARCKVRQFSTLGVWFYPHVAYDSILSFFNFETILFIPKTISGLFSLSFQLTLPVVHGGRRSLDAFRPTDMSVFMASHSRCIHQDEAHLESPVYKGPTVEWLPFLHYVKTRVVKPTSGGCVEREPS